MGHVFQSHLIDTHVELKLVGTKAALKPAMERRAAHFNITIAPKDSFEWVLYKKDIPLLHNLDIQDRERRNWREATP